MIKNPFKPKKNIDTKVVVNIDDDKLKDIVIQTIKERELEKEKQAKKSKKPLYQIGDTTLSSQKTFFISANGENINNKELKKRDILAFYPTYKAKYIHTWKGFSLFKKQSNHNKITNRCEVNIYISCNDYDTAVRLATEFYTVLKQEQDVYKLDKNEQCFIPSVEFHSLEKIQEPVVGVNT